MNTLFLKNHKHKPTLTSKQQQVSCLVLRCYGVNLKCLLQAPVFILLGPQPAEDYFEGYEDFRRLGLASISRLLGEGLWKF